MACIHVLYKPHQKQVHSLCVALEQKWALRWCSSATAQHGSIQRDTIQRGAAVASQVRRSACCIVLTFRRMDPLMHVAEELALLLSLTLSLLSCCCLSLLLLFCSFLCLFGGLLFLICQGGCLFCCLLGL